MCFSFPDVFFEQPAGLHLVKIQTSPNDRMLWALDNRGNVLVRIGITEEMPVGTAWEHIPGMPPICNLVHCFSIMFFGLRLSKLS